MFYFLIIFFLATPFLIRFMRRKIGILRYVTLVVKGNFFFSFIPKIPSFLCERIRVLPVKKEFSMASILCPTDWTQIHMCWVYLTEETKNVHLLLRKLAAFIRPCTLLLQKMSCFSFRRKKCPNF